MRNQGADLNYFWVLMGLLAVSLPVAAQDSGSSDEPLPIRIQLNSYVTGARLAPGALAIAVQPWQLTTPQSENGNPVPQPPTVYFDGNVQVEVEFQVAGQDPVRVATTAYSSNSVYVIIPPDLPPGPIHAAFVIDSVIQELDPFVLAPHAPVLPSVQRIYQGPVLAQNYPASGVAQVGHTNPAIGDEWVTLWLTGLNQATAADVTVRIADQEVTADFAGASGIPGVDQINFRMPSHPYLGCYVPIEVDVAGYRSNQASIATGDGEGDCVHPLELSHEDLAALDAYLGNPPLSGALPRVGRISFNRYKGPADDVHESIYAILESLGAFSVVNTAGLQMPDSMLFGCRSMSPGSSAGPGGAFFYVGDYGTLSFIGPNGQQIEIAPDKTSSGATLPFYNFSATNADPPTFTPGFWLVSVPEGDGLLAFQEAFRLPPVPQLLGDPAAPFTFTRTGENLVEWDTSGYQPSEMVQVRVTAPSAIVTCTAQATDGRLSIPGDLLYTSPDFQYTDTLSTGPALSIQAIPYPPDRTVFYMPLTDGSFGRGVFDYRLSGVGRDVTFQ